MVDWATQYVPPSKNASILEVGSGNGTLLLALVDAGYDPKRMAGIDYSLDAVLLAKSVAKSRGAANISFHACDFLHDVPPSLPDADPENRQDIWDVVLDKGTYDAIALGQIDENGRSPAARYPERVAKLLKPGGYFLITCMSS